MSGETESEILCWTRFWFRQRNCSSCESCWVKRILTKKTNRRQCIQQNRMAKLKTGIGLWTLPDTNIFGISQRFPSFTCFQWQKSWIVGRFSVFRAGNCHFISRQSNKFNTACVRDSIFESPIFSRFADFSVKQRASIQVSEARKFLSLESVFFKFLFYVNAV